MPENEDNLVHSPLVLLCKLILQFDLAPLQRSAERNAHQGMDICKHSIHDHKMTNVQMCAFGLRNIYITEY